MLRRLIFSLLAVLALCGAACADVRILLYHRVGDSRYPTTNVSTEAFRAQMQYLKDEGYTVVSTAALEAYLLRGAPLPEKAAAIHFDDALRTVYTAGFPILKEFGYPFAVFVTTEPVENRYPDYLTWEMLAEMAKSGGEVGVHGHSHQYMSGRAKGESQEAFDARMLREIDLPRKILQGKGFKADWFAYTFGDYGPDLIAKTKASGITLGFVQDPGAVDRESDPYLLNRYAVVGSVADMKIFRERMSYAALPMTDRAPQYGRAKMTGSVVYSARLLHPERYVANTANVFVSDLGRLEATFDPATGVVRASGGKIPPNKLNRVIVSIREKSSGRYALGSWAIITGND